MNLSFFNRKVKIVGVYDDAELSSISPEIRFLREVKIDFRTKQMLVFPIKNAKK